MANFSAWTQSQESPALNWKAANPQSSTQPKTAQEMWAELAAQLQGGTPTVVDQPKLQQRLGKESKSSQDLANDLAKSTDKRQGSENENNYKVTSEQVSNSANTLTPFQLERMQKMVTGGSQTYTIPEERDERGNIVTPAREQTDTFEGNPAYLEQKRGNEVLQNFAMANIEHMPNQLDLTPLMALTDAWSGSKLSGSYQKPVTVQERAKTGFDTMSEVQKRRESLSAKLEDLIKVQKAGYDTQKLNEIEQRLNKATYSPDVNKFGAGSEANRLARLEKDIRTDIDKSVITPINTRSEQFQNMDDYFKSGDYQAISASMGSFLRGIAQEKGVLTDQDIQRNLPRNFNGTVAKFFAYFSETPTDQLDPAYTDSLRKIVNTARGNAAKVYGELINDKKKNYKNSRSYTGINVDGFFDTANSAVGRFGKPTGPSLDTKSGQTQSTKKAVLTPEQEARRQELLRKAGK